MATIMVLNDGETYTDARWCKLTTVPDEAVSSDLVEQTLYLEEDEVLLFVHDFGRQTVIELTDLGRQRVIVR